MRWLHQRICKKYNWYNKWHHDPACNALHLFLFAVFAALAMAVLNVSFANTFSLLSALVEDEIRFASIFARHPLFSGKIVGFEADHILVKFRDNIALEQISQALERNNLKSRSQISQLNVHFVNVPLGITPQAVVELLERNESGVVEFAEIDQILEPSFTPNDPWFANWQLDKQLVQAQVAWNTTTGQNDIIIAVADTGVDCSHQDLVQNCVPGWNVFNDTNDATDQNGHGTKVAGVAGAIGNNSIGIAGMVWNAKIMPIKISGADGLSSYSAIAKAVTFAADNGAWVVNNSYQSGGSKTVQTAAKYLYNKGGLLVVSQGNFGTETNYQNNPYIISVSASDNSDVLYSWSSYGSDVDVSAPGCTGATTILDNRYGSFCGTSNSAPEVSGLLALVWAVNPVLGPNDAQKVIFDSAIDLGILGWDEKYGWGRINAASAVALAPIYKIEQIQLPVKSQGRGRVK